MKYSDAINTSDLETDRNEAILTNAALGISPNSNAGSTCIILSNDGSTEVKNSLNIGARNFDIPTSDYCELEKVVTGGIQCDSQYQQLDHGKYYDPLIVYEQLQ